MNKKLRQRLADEQARGRPWTQEHEESWAAAAARRDASGYYVRVYRLVGKASAASLGE